MAIWDSESSDYLRSGADQYGVTTDWGAEGGPRRFGMQDYWTRGARGGMLGTGGRKKLNKTGSFELGDGDMEGWRAMKESGGGRIEVDRKSRRFSGADQYGLGHLTDAKRGGTGLGALFHQLSPEKKARDKRLKGWELETGPRADVRRAMLKNRKSGLEAYQSSRNDLASGLGY